MEKIQVQVESIGVFALADASFIHLLRVYSVYFHKI